MHTSQSTLRGCQHDFSCLHKQKLSHRQAAADEAAQPPARSGTRLCPCRPVLSLPGNTTAVRTTTPLGVSQNNVIKHRTQLKPTLNQVTNTSGLCPSPCTYCEEHIVLKGRHASCAPGTRAAAFLQLHLQADSSENKR